MEMDMSQKTLTRLDLIEALIAEIGLPRTETIELVEMMLSEIANAATRGEDVKLSHFGTFSLLDKVERIGRNPKTGEEVAITPRRVMSFRPSAQLKDRVNNGGLDRLKS